VGMGKKEKWLNEKGEQGGGFHPPMVLHKYKYKTKSKKKKRRAANRGDRTSNEAKGGGQNLKKKGGYFRVEGKKRGSLGDTKKTNKK